VNDDSIKDLHRKIVRAGGNTALVIFGAAVVAPSPASGPAYFTLPAVRPPTRCRSISAKSTTTGTIAMTAAANS
jgi:hypothetical protein